MLCWDTYPPRRLDRRLRSVQYRAHALPNIPYNTEKLPETPRASSREPDLQNIESFVSENMDANGRTAYRQAEPKPHLAIQSSASSVHLHCRLCMISIRTGGDMGPHGSASSRVSEYFLYLFTPAHHDDLRA
jgi:hypothetical protein